MLLWMSLFLFCLCTPSPSSRPPKLAFADKASTRLGHWAQPLEWPWAWWACLRVIGSLSMKPIQEGKQWQIWKSSNSKSLKTGTGRQTRWPTLTVTTQPSLLLSAWAFFNNIVSSLKDVELLRGFFFVLAPDQLLVFYFRYRNQL